MPDARYLAILIDELRQEIDANVAAFRDGLIDVDTLQQRMARDLTEHHLAAYLVGRDDQVIRAADKRLLADLLGDQIDYLNGFADTLQANEDNEWRSAYEARARMYAGSLTETYWRGQTRGYDLPGYPAQGTACLTNCGCQWRLETSDDGTIRAYWERHKDDSCSTCLDRAARWNPYIVEA